MKKNVLLIDPWGVHGAERYLNGLVNGLSSITNLTLITNKYYEEIEEVEYKVVKLFFPKSENMNSCIKRKVLRGLEYINAYKKIIKYLDKKHFDIIHINWLLMYSVDQYFLKALKRKCDVLVYTAHNVIPHVDGEKKICVLRKIYKIADKIILHGNIIKDEFDEIYPEFSDKVYIQKHGAGLQLDTFYNESEIPNYIVDKVSNYNRVFLFIGNIFYNKGVDRLIPIWETVSKENLLIIVGKVQKGYAELENYLDRIEEINNIMFIGEYVSDNVANYLIAKSDLLLMPYRHASMSAVVFTAASFAKTVWCTKVGALEEYLNEDISFLTDNTEEKISESLRYICEFVQKDKLEIMGKRLQKYIQETCSWECIAKGIVDNCYKKEKNTLED